MEVRRFAPSSLRLGHVNRDTPCGPDVVEVHPCGHDHHQSVVWPEGRDLDQLVLDRLLRFAVAIGTNQLRVHPSRYLADRRDLSDRVDVLPHPNLAFGPSDPGTLDGLGASRQSSCYPTITRSADPRGSVAGSYPGGPDCASGTLRRRPGRTIDVAPRRTGRGATPQVHGGGVPQGLRTDRTDR